MDKVAIVHTVNNSSESLILSWIFSFLCSQIIKDILVRRALTMRYTSILIHMRKALSRNPNFEIKTFIKIGWTF